MLRSRAILAAIAATLSVLVIPSIAEAATPTTTSAATTTTVIPFGSDGWSYYRSSTAPPKTWRSGVGSWKTGTAPIGSGTGVLATKLPSISGATPLAAYFSRPFTVNLDTDSDLKLTSWADDGVVLYVNGHEVARRNLAPGVIRHTSYATAAPRTATAMANTFTVTIPAKYLRDGNNVLAAQVQSNWHKTPDISFDARLRATSTAPAAPSPEPSPPTTDPTTPEPGADQSGDVAGWGTPSWRDEFTYVDPATNKPAIDPGKWNVRGRSDLGLLFDAAVPDTSMITEDANGIAHIRANWLSEPVIRPADQSGPRELWHKTGYMDQRYLQSGDVSNSQVYGRWEMRAKVPTGPHTLGSLAAFWLRNQQSGEIDIMEAWGYADGAAAGGQRIDTATTTVHTHTSGVNNEKYIWHHADYGAATPVWQDFHTFAFEYTPTYAAIVVDNVPIARATPADHPNLWNPKYFGSPMHMRVNLHVGPSAKYWGLPDPNNRAQTQNLDYQIDYVRVWKYQG